MKFKNIIISILIFLITVLILIPLKFSGHTKEIINTYLPIVWAVLVAYATALIILNRALKEEKNVVILKNEDTSKDVLQVVVSMVLQTFVFLLMTVIYYLRSLFLRIDMISSNIELLKIIFDSVLVGLVINFCVVSILIGAYVLHIEVNKD